MDGKMAVEELAVRLDSDLKTGLHLSKVSELKDKMSLKGYPLQTNNLTTQLFNFLFLLIFMKSFLAMVCYGVSHFLGVSVPIYLVAGLIVLFVLFETVFLCLYYNWKVKRALKQIENKKTKVAVLRDGVTYNIAGQELLPGDLVLLRQGDVVCADLRIFEALDLKVDRSAWGGEGEEMTLIEGSNVIHAPAVILQGSGKGIVVNIGVETKLGGFVSTAKSAINFNLVTMEANKIFRIFLGFAIGWAVVVFVTTFVSGYNWIDGISFSLYVALLNISENAILVLTFHLVVMGERLLKKNVVIKDLKSILTIGNVSVLLVDKNNLMTSHWMRISNLLLSDVIINETEEELIDKRSDAWRSLLRVAMFCNEASFEPHQDKVPVFQRECQGNSVDVCLLRFVENELGGVVEARRRSPPIAHTSSLPHNIHASVNHFKGIGKMALLKGPPNDVISICSSVMVGDKLQSLDSSHAEFLMEKFKRLETSNGELVAFCDMVLDKPDSEDKTEVVLASGGYRFLGAVSLVQQVDKNVPQIIHQLRMAGIKVVMMAPSNDPLSSQATALQANIFTSVSDGTERTAFNSYKQITLYEDGISNKTTKQLAEMLEGHHEMLLLGLGADLKTSVVKALQSLGHIVAMHSSQAEDLPALAQTNISISATNRHNDVAIQMSNTVLEAASGDKLEEVLYAISQGRLLADNLKKSMVYLLSSILPLAGGFLLSISLDIPHMFSIVGMLVLRHGIEVLPALCLAFERAEVGDLMEGRIVRSFISDSILNRRSLNVGFGQTGMIQLIAGVVSYFAVMYMHGFEPQELFGVVNNQYRSDLYQYRNQFKNDYRNLSSDEYGDLSGNESRWLEESQDLFDAVYRNETMEWQVPPLSHVHWEAQTSFLITVASLQVFNAILCKSKSNSIVQQGMLNHYLTFSIFFSCTVLVLVVLLPINSLFQLIVLSWKVWLFPLPFCLLLFILDEGRKAWIRKWPGGFVCRENIY